VHGEKKGDVPLSGVQPDGHIGWLGNWPATCDEDRDPVASTAVEGFPDH